MLTFHIISLFPESIGSYIDASIVKRAVEKKKIAVKSYNLRDFAVPRNKDKSKYQERRVDDRPYGGGPGMVIEALPVLRAVNKAVGRKVKAAKSKVKIVFFSPSGEQFSNQIAESWIKYSDIVLICGRYEGIDARIKKYYPMADISVGPYTLTGGELPALIVLDAVSRRIEGVLGDHVSVEEKRIAGKDVYTRPESIEFRGKKAKVPKILLTGHHKNIDMWKLGRTSEQKQDKIG